MRYVFTTLTTLLLFAMVAAASGATINVPGDYLTIQAAINAASDGDTIQVAAGTYTEMITINKAIIVQGAGAGQSIIDGTGLTGAPSVKIIPPASGSTVTFSNFTVQNAAGIWSSYWNGYDYFPVMVSGGGSGIVEIKNCEFVGRWDVTSADGDWGVYLIGITADARVKYNTFRHLASNAMLVEQCSGPVEIAWNTFRDIDVGAPPVYFMIYGDKTVSAKQWIHNNTFSGAGISLWGGFSSYGSSGFGTYKDVEISYNVITDVDPNRDGISLVADNPPYNGNPTTINGFEGAKVIGNVIKGTGTPVGRGGIRLFGLMTDTVVKYNSVTNSFRGVQLIGWPDEPSGELITYPASTIINYNSLTGNTTDLYNESEEEVNATYNWWGRKEGPRPEQISGKASYDPWLSAPAELYLDVAPASLYVRPGETVNIKLKQRNLTSASAGYQAWLAFETDKLSFSSGSYTASPYGLPVITPIAADGDNIDLAAGINPVDQDPATADADLVDLTFIAGSTNSSTVVTFRTHDPATMLTDLDGDEIIPATTDSQTIVIDGTLPTVTVTSPNGGEYLKGGGSWTITWTASDTNMAPNPIKIEYWDGSAWQTIADGEANDGSYTWNPVPSIDIATAKVRVTATDLAGNSASDESDNPFTIDSTKPVVTNITLTAIGSDTDLTPDGTAIQGTYRVSVYVADNLAGVDYSILPTIEVTDASGHNLTAPGMVTEDPTNNRFYLDVMVTPASANGVARIKVSGVTDKSGNVADPASDTFNINKTTLTVNIQLESVDVATVQRYIKLVLGGDQSSGAKQTYTPQITFTGGTGTIRLTNVSNAGVWTKISAKDEQHTLRRTVNLTDPTGNKQYVANFTGTNQLLGGDVNNDQMVDIRDFGIYAGQYGTSPALNTQWPTKNANISCDGFVDTNDFTYVQINFLKVSSAEVGYAAAAMSVPLSSIKVNDLAKQIGVVAAKKADLNYDGVVDQKDMALFAKKR